MPSCILLILLITTYDDDAINPSSIKEAAEVTCDQARRKREFTTKEDNLDTAHSHDPLAILLRQVI